MKVAFWSTQRGRNGVTSNLACMSVLSNMYRPRRTILFENHQNINNLGNMLIQKQSHDVLQEQKVYEVNGGLEQMLRHIRKQEWINEEQLLRSCVSLLTKNLFYLSRNFQNNQEYLEYELNQHLKSLLDITESICETIYVDTVNSNISTRKILKEADMVVVNLSQNPYVLSHFFRNFKEVQEKAFYLIAHYEQHSVYSKTYIEKEYGVRSDRIGMIPHSIGFSDAMSEGRLIPFLRSIDSCCSSNIHYDFMSRAKEAAMLFDEYCCVISERGKCI